MATNVFNISEYRTPGREFDKQIQALWKEDSMRMAAYISENWHMRFPSIEHLEIDITHDSDRYIVYFIGSFQGSPLAVCSVCVKTALVKALDKLEDFQKIQDRVPIAALNPINVKPMTEFKRG
jgi:hypothetical protein